MTTLIYSALGVLLQTLQDTAPHPSGVACARDERGVPYAFPDSTPSAPAPRKAPTPVADPGPVAPDLLQICRDMDRADADCWTRSGKPRVESIELRLARNITVAQRDAAWQIVKGEQQNEQP